MGSLIPTVYMSTDPGAPQLSGQVGSLTTLLDAILVDGYGSGGDSKQGLGWSREFIDTNIRVYRNDPVLGTGKRLHVDDSAPAAGGAREALLRGYHNWSGDEGDGPFPKPEEVAAGIVWGKSSTASATDRAWVAIGNSVSLYLFVAAYNDNLLPWLAGDFKSFKPADVNSFVLAGHETPNTGNGQKTRALYQQASTATIQPGAGMYLASNAGMTIKSQVARFLWGGLTNTASQSQPYGYGTGRSYPGPVSGSLDLQRCLIGEGQYMERGWASGCYIPLHDRPLEHLKVYPGLGPGGVDLLAVNYATSTTANQYGQILFELGVEW